MSFRRENTLYFQKCTYCLFKSKSRFFMIEHLNNHESGTKAFECTPSIEMYQCCNYNTEEIIKMNAHIRKFHLNILECQKMETKTTNQYYVCRNCEFQTYSLLNWYKHSLDVCFYKQLNEKNQFEKSQTNDLKCAYCDYRTKFTKKLKEHTIRKHLKKNRIKWFKCNHCNYKCKAKSSLTVHIKCRHLKEDEIEWFKCEHCDYKCKRKHHLKQHFMSRHLKEDEIKWILCDKCDYKTKRNGNLKAHVKRLHCD